MNHVRVLVKPWNALETVYIFIMLPIRFGAVVLVPAYPGVKKTPWNRKRVAVVK